MLLAEFSIWPMDKGESVSPYVARCLDIVDCSKLPYKLGPLGTCIEGEWPEVMAVIQKCYEELSKDCNRITCTVKMDWRKNHSGRLQSKVDSVEKKLGRPLRK
ncbi:MAG TPA: MTH1187 family thiamine-binding protein [Tepidisphaeraceae bacterium]